MRARCASFVALLLLTLALPACEGQSTPTTTGADGSGASTSTSAGSDGRAATAQRPAPPTRRRAGPAPVPSDFHLATRIRMRLMADEMVDETALRVRVARAVVTLEGSVSRGEQSVRAAAIAAATYGVASVDNRLAGPEPSAAEQRRAALVPASVLALEPHFATALTNYATGETIAAYFVVRGPDDEAPPGVVATPVPPLPSPAGDPVATSVIEPTPGQLAPPPPPEPEPALGPRRYTVQIGESLWSIARDQLGDGHRWEALFELNRRVIGDDPDGIRAGMVLRLPR